ncbi:hypothetical protein [Burkholderia sp. BCC0405]|uniref:hypothetical protein n=1 Tax=Burkholderia sp. BCC0405 TaxID=2676298 RepID=UPI00158E0EE9|nr:hypothetical protein [Burkholderia sp. BCC0405]
MTHVKTAFSGLRNRCGGISCFCFETFGHFDRLRIPLAAWHAGRFARSGKSRVKIFDPLRSAATGIPAYNACGKTYVKFETFRVSGPGPESAGIAGTLDAPRFRSGWPALCVSVGTAVDEVTSRRFRQKTDGTGFGITRGKEGRSASGNTQLQADRPHELSSNDP